MMLAPSGRWSQNPTHVLINSSCLDQSAVYDGQLFGRFSSASGLTLLQSLTPLKLRNLILLLLSWNCVPDNLCLANHRALVLLGKTLKDERHRHTELRFKLATCVEHAWILGDVVRTWDQENEENDAKLADVLLNVSLRIILNMMCFNISETRQNITFGRNAAMSKWNRHTP